MQGTYGISPEFSIKRRIDKKIVVNGKQERNAVLSIAESEVLSNFNEGKEVKFVLNNFEKNRGRAREIIQVLIERRILVKNSHRKVDLSPKWTLDEVFFELTKRCNLNCHHCYIPKDIQSHEMRLDQWMKIINECKTLGVGLIKLTGGEPMCYPDFWKILEKICEIGIGTRLYTNGSYLNEESISNLVGLKIDEIQISIDGATKETHDTFRRTVGGFDKILDALPILERYGVKTILSFTITNYNVNEINQFIELAKKFTNVKVVISPYINYHQTYMGDRFIDVNDEVIQRLKLCFDENKKIWSDKVKYSLSFSNRFIGYCGFGLYSLYIDSTGKIMLCPLLNKMVIGKVDDGLINVWDNSMELTEYRKHTLADIEKCNSCIHINVCKGGCRARAYLTNGTFLSHDPISCKMW